MNLERFLKFYPNTQPQVFLYSVILIFLCPPNLHSDNSSFPQRQTDNSQHKNRQRQNEKIKRYVLKKVVRKENTQENNICMCKKNSYTSHGVSPLWDACQMTRKNEELTESNFTIQNNKTMFCVCKIKSYFLKIISWRCPLFRASHSLILILIFFITCESIGGGVERISFKMVSFSTSKVLGCFCTLVILNNPIERNQEQSDLENVEAS